MTTPKTSPELEELAQLLLVEGCWCGDCEFAGWDSCPECRQTCHVIATAITAAGYRKVEAGA